MKDRLQKLTGTINIIFIIAVLLFLLDCFSPIEIKNQFLKSFAYFGTLLLPMIILTWNWILIKSRTKRIIGLVFPMVVLIPVFIAGPINMIFSSSAWRTQTILYQNQHLSFKKVEFQMQDMGALGYNYRTVEVLYLSNLFMFTRNAPNHPDEDPTWAKVCLDINEIELKSP